MAAAGAQGGLCTTRRPTHPTHCQDIHHSVRPDQVELVRRDYTANGGWETFLAYEDPRQDILVGLLRLRKVSGPPRGRQPTLRGRVSMVRELHVYGAAVSVHTREAGAHQHRGYGALLMAEAERVAAAEHRSTKLAVISGVGTRHYYRKLGYELEGPYMVKALEVPPRAGRGRGPAGCTGASKAAEPAPAPVPVAA